MDRQVGVGVIGLGWMGRVHAAALRRVPDHFPALRLAPRLVTASDVSADQRAHAEHVGFEQRNKRTQQTYLSTHERVERP